MDRRTYEQMMREIRAIHLALTGEELREDDPRPGDEGGGPPCERALRARFAELAAEARSIPSVALELWALGLDDDRPCDDAARGALPAPIPEHASAPPPGSGGVHAEPAHEFLSAADTE